MSSSNSEAPALERTSTASGVNHRALILVVERNPVVQRLERFFLEQAGYTVEFANDGITALERARKLKPKILVTEILVPKLDGLSLCRALKSDPVTRDIMVLVFSHLPEKLFNDGFELMYRSPVEMQLDSIATELFRRVRDGKLKRVVIDALGDLERSSIDHQRFSDFIYLLTQWFASRNVTCLMMYELSDLFEVHGLSDQQVSNMSDNILLLRFTPDIDMERTIRIIKTRGSAHDNHERTLRITNKGVAIE